MTKRKLPLIYIVGRAINEMAKRKLNINSQISYYVKKIAYSINAKLHFMLISWTMIIRCDLDDM